jgi:hypothetical protein
MCGHARDFAAWIEENIQAVLKYPTPISLNQSKLRLLDRYFDYRAAVTKAHRDCIGERNHLCIFHIFERAFQQLRLCELKLTPPLLFIPPAPAAPSMPTPKQVVDVIFGFPDTEHKPLEPNG